MRKGGLYSNIARCLLLIAIYSLCCKTFAAYSHTIETTDSICADDTIKKSEHNIIKKIINHFNESNKPKQNKKFDVSIIGGPHYSSDTKFGIGLVAAGIYRTSIADTLTQHSNVSLYGDVTTSGFYKVGIRGNHIFPEDKFRFDYNLYFYSFPTKYWGIGYNNARNKENETDYDDLRIQMRVDFYIHLMKGLYFGPGISFDWIKARRVENRDIWGNLPLTTRDFGIGLQARWDTRDNLTAPEKGWLIELNQKFYPKHILNDDYFADTDFHINHYFNVWKGGIIAARYHTKISYGDVPWGMLPTFGGSSCMRGYYEGKYRDKGEMDLTIELRQHVWRRNGIVIWGGVGSVFPKLSRMRIDRLLPNCGIGYRWEFKKHTNVRLDFGIGKGETGFIFNIDEAF